MENPNLHVLVFLEVCDMLKINGASNDAIFLSLSPFSLRDKVRVELDLCHRDPSLLVMSSTMHFLPNYFL